jgi:probable rRNA maturation factor
MLFNIVVEDESWKSIRGLKALAKKTLAVSLTTKAKTKEITILFADDATLKTLNKDWRGKNRPTNILSFPASPDLKLPRGQIKPLGDIALAFETVAKEAEASGKSIKDHTTHLIVHGVLHLLGYDHLDDADANRMEAKEIRILKKLGVADPYQN